MNRFINIITRTSDRPKSFKKCLKSIQEQTYTDINHIVICDTLSSVAYIREHNIEPYYIDKRTLKFNPIPPIGRRSLPWNLYFNQIDSELLDGYILYLDDDDQLSSSTIIEELMNEIKDIDTMYLFKVKLAERYIPNKEQLIPILNDFSGSGFLYHTKYWKNNLWFEFSGSDHYCGMKLYHSIPNKQWINITVVTAIRANRGKKIE